MAISQLLNILNGARKLAKLDPATAFPGEVITEEDIKHHQILVRAGKIGAFIGVVFGTWVGYELYLHPHSPTRDARSLMMTFVFAPLMMVAVGMLGGVSWAGVFVPSAFFSGPIGAHWMKLCGTKGSKSTRFVAALSSLLTTGVFIFVPICVRLGKV
jgi:hypothetical protein